jgi:hypothetical protein
MSVASQTRTIDDLTKQAAKALKRSRLFEAERLSLQALDLARDECDFERMASIVPTLYEARRQQIDTAADTGRMTILETPFSDEIKIKPGCYLVRPPLVGADARRFRLLAFGREVPVAVLCREPRAAIGLCPVVGLGGGATVRMKVDPPLDPDNPEIDWFLDAMDALGEAALDRRPAGQARCRSRLRRPARLPGTGVPRGARRAVGRDGRAAVRTKTVSRAAARLTTTWPSITAPRPAWPA